MSNHLAGRPLPAGWEARRLGDVVSRVTRRNDVRNGNILTISAHEGLVNQEEFFNRRIASADLSPYFLLQRGDFAYNKSYSAGFPVGVIRRLDRYPQGVVSPLYICFRPTTPGVSSDYLAHYFQSGLLDNDIAWIAKEGARNHGLLNVSVGDLFSVPIQLPSFADQVRMAEILDRATDAIKSAEEVIAKLELAKEGLIHDLFTRGISDVSRTRNPVSDGVSMSDSVGNKWPAWWSARTLASFVDPVRPITYGIVQAGPDVRDGVPYVRTVDLKDGGLAIHSLLRTSHVIANGYRRSTIRTGDVVCGIRATVGKFQVIPKELDGVNISRGVARFALVNDISGEFLTLALNSAKGKRLIGQTLKGSTFLELTLRQLGALEIHVPPLAEQLEIVARVGALDRRISTEVRQFSKLRLLNQGLRYDLLTGRVQMGDSA